MNKLRHRILRSQVTSAIFDQSITILLFRVRSDSLLTKCAKFYHQNVRPTKVVHIIRTIKMRAILYCSSKIGEKKMANKLACELRV